MSDLFLQVGFSLPDLFLLVMSCVLILVDVFVSARYAATTYYLTQATLIGAFLLSLPLLQTGHVAMLVWHDQYVADQLAGVSKLSIYLFGLFAFAYAQHAMIGRSTEKQGAYYLLGILAILGMSIMASANTFLTIYLGLELLSLSLYAMIAIQKTSHAAIEAAMKYFVLGSMASALLLYGISLLFGLTGSIQMEGIFHGIQDTHNMALWVGLIFVLAGMLFKFGAFPFHMWVPDTYEGAATPTTLFVASAPKIATFAALFRILMNALPNLHLTWVPILIVLSILSMAFGNLLAIVQSNFKRLLAYSSIAHVGYMLLGFIAAPTVASGGQAAFFYILTYALVAVAAFAMITLMSQQGIACDQIEDYRGFNARHPWLAFIMLILMFSLAGIPPTVGFIAKLSLLQALIEAGFSWLALAALFFALIGAYYYLRVVMLMYFEEPGPVVRPMPKLAWPMMLAITLNGGAALVLGIMPNALLQLCQI
jgi:NADH-quinone oxidoreductase subunit N